MTTATRTQRRGSALRALGDHLLTVLAVAGTLCIVLVLLGWFLSISIIMFRTGSMSPTITAGSIAFVQEIPATEMEEGDVVTVDRGEHVLPVTHRVVAIDEEAGPAGEVTFTMRGDANDTEDPEPYTATEVRRVLFSIPAAARVIQWFSSPVVLGGLTVGATALVIWAFWPREHPAEGAPEHPVDEDGDLGGPPPPERTTAGAVGLPLLAALVLAAPGPVGADSTLVTGEHLRMRTIGDPVAMQSLSPGDPVVWEVGVWADAPEPGTIRLAITGRGELAQRDDALMVTVHACAEPWSGDRCGAGERELLASRSLDRIAQAEPTLPLTTLPSDEERWLRVEVVLGDAPGISGADGDVLIHASGVGEEISGGPDAPDGPDGPDAPGGPAPEGPEAPGPEAPGPEAPGPEAPGADGPPADGEAPGDGSGWIGDGLARTGVSGIPALLGGGLLALAVGTALRRRRGRPQAET